MEADMRAKAANAPVGQATGSGHSAASTAAAGEGLEQALASLKSFARIALEECHEPLVEAVSPAKVRWEIYSTWMLLLCIHHAEAQAERCRQTWKPRPWRTEAEGLRNLFMYSRSARILAAVLRWLRWAHFHVPGSAEATMSEGAEQADTIMAEDGWRAGYERTLQKMRTRSLLPVPFQAASVLHPDGPLQSPSAAHSGSCFDEADLEDERRLLRELWVDLRRGDLHGAFKLCIERGQAWRTAMLQGMQPFADCEDEQVDFEAMQEDDDEELLARIKEDHTDWTELGVVEGSAISNGNPWRRVWKEQCWDVAERALHQGRGSMELLELAIYGFCGGHCQAILTVCGSSWADRCFGKLHCLKEALVERLLEDAPPGREDRSLFPGQGDEGVPDVFETPEDRRLRLKKLCGCFDDVAFEEIDAIVVREVRQTLLELEAERGGRQPSASFVRLQAILIQAAWEPEQHEAALDLLRQWLTDGFDDGPGHLDTDKALAITGAASCPFVIKQFATHFAMWLKGATADQQATSREGDAMEQVTSASAPHSMDVDDIVNVLVRDLVSAASGAWEQQCIEGQAVELIAEHIAVLTTNSRLRTFADFLLKLGTLDGRSMDGGRGLDETLQAKVLERCFWVFWGRFPEEVFALLEVLVRRVLQVQREVAAVVSRAAGEEEEELPDAEGPGVPVSCESFELNVTLRCMMAFWVVLRDKAADTAGMNEAFSGLELFAGEPLEAESERTSDDLVRIALELVVLPFMIDALLSLAVEDSENAVDCFKALQHSQLWSDAVSSEIFMVGSPLHSPASLADLVWYLGLCERHASWKAASISTAASSGASEAQRRCQTLRNQLLEHALPRLARDAPLLIPAEPGLSTMLDAHRREQMRRELASRVLLHLLSIFESAGDFKGAMHDLAVAVAQSPWMLTLLHPKLVRFFLHRVSLIPVQGAAGAEALGPSSGGAIAAY